MVAQQLARIAVGHPFFTRRRPRRAAAVKVSHSFQFNLQGSEKHQKEVYIEIGFLGSTIFAVAEIRRQAARTILRIFLTPVFSQFHNVSMSQGKVDRFGSAKRRSFYRFVLAFSSIAVLFGVAFWVTWGDDLHYNVYSDGDFWYREEFPGYFNLIVTSLVGVIFGLIGVAIIRIAQHLRRP